MDYPASPSPDLPTVFVVDDDPGMRGALQRLFHGAGFVVQAFESGEDLLARGDLARPGVLLLDVAMPGVDGLELQALLAERGVDVPIVFLSATHSVPTAVAAMQHGAVDFVEKPFENDVLVERVRRAALRRRTPNDRARIAGWSRAAQALTPREREIMALVVTGLTSKEMARQLGVSPRTVEVHRMHLMAKMHASSLAELVGMALALEAA